MQDSLDLTKLLFGRLSWDAIPFHEPILIATFAGVVVTDLVAPLAKCGGRAGFVGDPSVSAAEH